MQLTKLKIQGLRGLDDVEFTLEPKTVFIGENNCGKSSILDAIKFALRSIPGRRVPPPEDLDFRIDESGNQTEKIVVQLHFQDSENAPWGEAVTQDLEGATQLDVHSGRYSLTLRYTADKIQMQIQETWEFLNLEDQPLKPGNRPELLRKLQRYVPLFQLEAVRDANEAFSSRASLWSSLLKLADIPPEEKSQLENEFIVLNQKLIQQAPKLQKAGETISGLNKVLPRKDTESVKVQPLSPRLLDLLSRSQIVIGPLGSKLELPLKRHGHGAQSLAVFFLFKSYFEQMHEDEERDIEPLLTLEEPEAHLHPQAARALWSQIEQLPGQVLVTSHSPYFTQNVPLHCIRVLRKDEERVAVRQVATTATVRIASEIDKVSQMAAERGFQYDKQSGDVTVTSPMCEETWRALCKKAPKEAKGLKMLLDLSKDIIPDKERRQLETGARQRRGEMFFARVWLLCEGDGDLQVLKLAFESMDIDPDPLGISIIDFQVGGAGVGAYASLARILGYRAFLFCDGDDAGVAYCKSFRDSAQLGDDSIFVAKPKLEGYLLKSPARDLTISVARRLSQEPVECDEDIQKALEAKKTGFPAELRKILQEGGEKLPLGLDLERFLKQVSEAARG